MPAAAAEQEEMARQQDERLQDRERARIEREREEDLTETYEMYELSCCYPATSQ